MEETQRGWDYSIQQLIQHGHSVHDIPNYTYKQFRIYVEAVNQLEKDRLRAKALLSRVATNASDEAFEKVLRKLFG